MKKKFVFFVILSFLFTSCQTTQTAYECKSKLNDKYYKNCERKTLYKCKNPSVIKNKIYCEVR